MTAQPGLSPLPIFPSPVHDTHRNKRQRDHPRQPRLIGSAARKANHSIDEPQKGKNEPDRRTSHFFPEHSTGGRSSSLPLDQRKAATLNKLREDTFFSGFAVSYGVRRHTALLPNAR